ncbi:hypothetical protein FAI40_03165 [Acetobacteraceae bacterium]|nr:hypothetical protein FAI40_03165 [Acetobacteraceae bacterium]
MSHFVKISFLTFCAFFAFSGEKTALAESCSALPCAKKDLLPFQDPFQKKSLPHGIRLVTINEEVAFLKLSLPRLQYETLYQKTGLTFRPLSLSA